jgi:hypothetical protein
MVMPTIEVAGEDKAWVMTRRRETPDRERKFESAATVFKRMRAFIEAEETKTGAKVV